MIEPTIEQTRAALLAHIAEMVAGMKAAIDAHIAYIEARIDIDDHCGSINAYVELLAKANRARAFYAGAPADVLRAALGPMH